LWSWWWRSWSPWCAGVASHDCALIDGDWKLIEAADRKRSLCQRAKALGESTDLSAKSPASAHRLEAELARVKKNLPAVTIRPRPGPGGRRGPGANGGPR
jgi:hypothetical protein